MKAVLMTRTGEPDVLQQPRLPNQWAPPQVSRTLPLEQSPTAHTLIEDGHVQGKIMLTM